jgi:hypothetical protein
LWLLRNQSVPQIDRFGCAAGSHSVRGVSDIRTASMTGTSLHYQLSKVTSDALLCSELGVRVLAQFLLLRSVLNTRQVALSPSLQCPFGVRSACEHVRPTTACPKFIFCVFSAANAPMALYLQVSTGSPPLAGLCPKTEVSQGEVKAERKNFVPVPKLNTRKTCAFFCCPQRAHLFL